MKATIRNKAGIRKKSTIHKNTKEQLEKRGKKVKVYI